jgi:hypothetical protein
MNSMLYEQLTSLLKGLEQSEVMPLAEEIEAMGVSNLNLAANSAELSEKVMQLIQAKLASLNLPADVVLSGGDTENSTAFDDAYDLLADVLAKIGSIELDGDIWIVPDNYGDNNISVEICSRLFYAKDEWTPAIYKLMGAAFPSIKITFYDRGK